MILLCVSVHHYTMTSTPHRPLSHTTIQFQQFSNAAVDKYCSVLLPYKPGLYSIHWESKSRVSGLLEELTAEAARIIRALELSGTTNSIAETNEQLDYIIYRSLLQYLEKIYCANYPDAEQPAWMIEIAQRLMKNTKKSPNSGS